jgi:ribosome-binding protein aMBF1 (putative translation factor)
MASRKIGKGLATKLRGAIRTSGLSAHQLSKHIDLSVPTITRFLLGSDMLLSRAEKIAAHFGFELTTIKATAPKRKVEGRTQTRKRRELR